MNRYLSELPQLFWVLCQFQQLGVKGHWGSVFSGDRKTDGCHVLFPQIQNGEQKAYVLKNKQLTGPTKGVICLEIDVIFNAVSLNFGFFVLLKSSVSWKLLFLICREFLSFLIFSKPWCILENMLLAHPHFLLQWGCRRRVLGCRPPACLPACERDAHAYATVYIYILWAQQPGLWNFRNYIANWTACKTCKQF